MIAGRIERATRVLGKSQGYLGLPVRDDVTEDAPSMTTAWLPTPDELSALNAGASVHVTILGSAHPPMVVNVGDPPA